MTCDRYIELMSSDIDAELTESETLDLHKHLEDCADCARLYAKMREQNQRLVAARTLERPKDLRAAIRKRIGLAEPVVRQAVWHVGHLPERPGFPIRSTGRKSSPGPMMGPWGRA